MRSNGRVFQAIELKQRSSRVFLASSFKLPITQNQRSIIILVVPDRDMSYDSLQWGLPTTSRCLSDTERR
jgi:hypothetical protein